MSQTAERRPLLRTEEALEIILHAVQPLPAETVPLEQSCGRVLFEEIVAGCSLPPFHNSAMDGFAVRSSDTSEASEAHPAVLRIIANLPAGSSDAPEVLPGTAARIMTGAPMPRGADAVVMVEDTRPAGESVEVLHAARASDNVRRAGEDVMEGGKVLASGTRIGPPEMAMLAALGIDPVPVYRQPRIAVLTTGAELVGPAESPSAGQIRDSNMYALIGQVTSAGCIISQAVRVSDTAEAIKEALERAAGSSDAIITSGGVSVGDYDLVKDVLSTTGSIMFWKVAIKPGKPFAFGTISGIPLFGLPGNPVSSMVTFDLFVRPALLALSGTNAGSRMVRGILSGRIRHKPGRTDYVRACTTWNDGFSAAPTGDQGSARISSMLGANSYVVVPESAGSLEGGAEVEVMLWDW